MAVDLLSLGTSGLQAARSNLNVTGHNINNVNTKGYSKQSAIIGTNDAIWHSGNYFGTGAYVNAVEREFSKYAVNNMNLAATDNSYYDTNEQLLTRMDGYLSQSGKNTINSMNEFYSTVNMLADNPDDLGTRKILLTKGQLFADNINDMSDTLYRENRDINDSLVSMTQRVSVIGKELASINHELFSTKGSINNDLLDRQNNLISELSTLTNVTSSLEQDGTYSVYIGNGRNLVSGIESNSFSMVAVDGDTKHLQFAMEQNGHLNPIKMGDVGGKIQANLEYRDEVIPSIQDSLGLMSVGFSESINKLQNQGLDLNGQIGKNMFTDFNDPMIAKSRVENQHGGDIKVYLSEINELKKGDYKITYQGSEYEIVDPSGKKTTQKLDAESNLNIDGLKININQAPALGESVTIKPLRNSGMQFDMVMQETREIAAQSFISNATKTNGSAKVSLDITGSTNLLPQQFSIETEGNAPFSKFILKDSAGDVIAPADYFVDDEGNTIIKIGTDANNVEIKLTEGAIDGDTYQFNFKPSSGDNSNLLKMQKVQQGQILQGNKSSIVDILEATTVDIGNRKALTTTMEEVSKVNLDAATKVVSNLSGVNLDEEAANLLRFQQAYSASSKVINIANELFQTILQSI